MQRDAIPYSNYSMFKQSLQNTCGRLDKIASVLSKYDESISYGAVTCDMTMIERSRKTVYLHSYVSIL